MIRLNYLTALAIPLLLTGCVIIDADDHDDVKNVAVIHEPGDDVDAFQHANAECGIHGMDARLVDVDEARGGSKIRSLFVCD